MANLMIIITLMFSSLTLFAQTTTASPDDNLSIVVPTQNLSVESYGKGLFINLGVDQGKQTLSLFPCHNYSYSNTVVNKLANDIDTYINALKSNGVERIRLNLFTNLTNCSDGERIETVYKLIQAL